MLNNSTGYSDAGSATGTRTADTEFLSGYCWSSVATASTSDGFNLAVPIRDQTLSAATITIGINAKLSSGASDWQVRGQLTDASGSTIGSAGSFVDFVPGATLDRTLLAITNPTQAGGHGVQLQFRRKTAAASTIRVGDVTVEFGATLGTWFTPIWLDYLVGILGTAHASPSVSAAQLWDEEGTTNLLLNPSAEVDATTGVSAFSGATITRDTTYAYIGSASFKVVTPNAVSQEGIALLSSAGLNRVNVTQTFPGRCRVRGSGTVLVGVRLFYTDATSADSTAVPVTLSDTWQDVKADIPTTNNAKTLNTVALTVRTNGQQSATFYVDAAQVDDNKAYATSYCDGSIGTGYSWSGTAHASTSTRAATSVTFMNTNRLRNDRGTFLARFRMDYDAGSNAQELLQTGTFGTGAYMALFVDGSSGTMIGGMRNGLASTDSVAGGVVSIATSYVAAFMWTETMIAVGVQPPALSTAVRATGPTAFSGTTASLGSSQSPALHINGLIGPVAIYDDELRASELAKVTALAERNDLKWDSVLRAA